MKLSDFISKAYDEQDVRTEALAAAMQAAFAAGVAIGRLEVEGNLPPDVGDLSEMVGRAQSLTAAAKFDHAPTAWKRVSCAFDGLMIFADANDEPQAVLEGIANAARAADHACNQALVAHMMATTK